MEEAHRGRKELRMLKRERKTQMHCETSSKVIMMEKHRKGLEKGSEEKGTKRLAIARKGENRQAFELAFCRW